MTKPTVTASHTREAVDLKVMGGQVRQYGVDVDARVTFRLGDHAGALEALDAMYADLKNQIGQAGEGRG